MTPTGTERRIPEGLGDRRFGCFARSSVSRVSLADRVRHGGDGSNRPPGSASVRSCHIIERPIERQRERRRGDRDGEGFAEHLGPRGSGQACDEVGPRRHHGGRRGGTPAGLATRRTLPHRFPVPLGALVSDPLFAQGELHVDVTELAESFGRDLAVHPGDRGAPPGRHASSNTRLLQGPCSAMIRTVRWPGPSRPRRGLVARGEEARRRPCGALRAASPSRKRGRDAGRFASPGVVRGGDGEGARVPRGDSNAPLAVRRLFLEVADCLGDDGRQLRRAAAWERAWRPAADDERIAQPRSQWAQRIADGRWLASHSAAWPRASRCPPPASRCRTTKRLRSNAERFIGRRDG